MDFLTHFFTLFVVFKTTIFKNNIIRFIFFVCFVKDLTDVIGSLVSSNFTFYRT